MAEVHDLSGKKIEQAIPKNTPRQVLLNLLARLESGEEVADQLLIIIEKPGKDLGMVSYKMFDTNIDVASTLWMLEACKLGLFE